VDKHEDTLNETCKMCKNGGNGICKVVGDLCDENILKRCVDECLRTHNKLNILVNNAAKFQLQSNLMQTTMENFDKIMNVNVRCVVQLSKLCVPHLIKTKGCIVNVSSSTASKCVGALPYSLSKAALDRFTKVTALELAEQGIRVNSVNCGHVTGTKLHQGTGWSDEDAHKYHEKIGKLYPLGRCAKPEEIANAIVWLCSDCSSFVTGETMRVDGGLSCTCCIEHVRCDQGQRGEGKDKDTCGQQQGRDTQRRC